MKPWLGWTTITEEELQAAQRLADQKDRGVRDELGLSAIHYLYSDRFFPGTSTQMTRLRYVFFVAGAYELLRRSTDPDSIETELPNLERRIAVQLKTYREKHNLPVHSSGIIGHTVVGGLGHRGRPPKLLPSMSYWTALRHWEFLNDEFGIPARSSVHAEWDLYARRPSHRGEVDETRTLFSDQLEKTWVDGLGGSLKDLGREKSPLPFELDDWERELLIAKLMRQRRSGGEHPTLLARLARLSKRQLIRVCNEPLPWSTSVQELLSEDPDEVTALAHARQAAYLVQLCRAAYDVLVARICRDRDRLPRASEFTDQFESELMAFLGPSSAEFVESEALDPGAMAGDIADQKERAKWEKSGLPAFLLFFQQWIKGGSDVESLRETFQRREFDMKQSHLRVRLTEGVDLRREWYKRQRNQRTTPTPLSYRWPTIANSNPSLLRDLAGGTNE